MRYRVEIASAKGMSRAQQARVKAFATAKGLKLHRVQIEGTDTLTMLFDVPTDFDERKLNELLEDDVAVKIQLDNPGPCDSRSRTLF
jgi:hypothetical protein